MSPSRPRASARRDARDFFANRVMVCDGAMGTMLQAAGVSLSLCLPELSVSRPELVSAIHDAYIAAGADIIETNTFLACCTQLGRHGQEGRVAEINLAAVRIARAAAAARERPVLVAGSVGPAMRTFSWRRTDAGAIRDAFREQIAALAEGGVDLIIFETFGSLRELIEAISAAQEVAPTLPLIAQMAFLDGGRTLAGETPVEVATRLDGLGLAAIGANCTASLQSLLDILIEMGRHTSLPLAAQPNAGSPTFVDGRLGYSADPADVARFAVRYVQAGVALMGGCCGTTPAHVAAAVAALAAMRRRPSRPAAPAEGEARHLAAS